jgi:hypothetical protein
MANEVTKVDSPFNLQSMVIPMLMMMMFAVLAAVLPTIQAQAAIATGQTYIGLEYNPVLYARPQLQWVNLVTNPPNTALVSASFFNDGPDPAYISINNPDTWLKLNKGESQDVTALGGQRRIEIIYYKTDPTQSATIRVNGKY